MQNDPYLHLPPPCSALAAVHRQRRPPAPSRLSRPLLRRALAPTRRGRPPPPPSSLALEPPQPCHAPRRFQSRPDGRHRDAAVERPLQSTPPSSSERPSTTHTPGLDFVRSFALPSFSHRRTPPPPRLNPGELTPTAEPPHRRSSARSDPLASTASPSCNSQATSPRPNPTGATPPPCSELHRPPLAVDRPPPALISRPKSLQRTASTYTPFPPTHTSPPVSPSPGNRRSNPRSPSDPTRGPRV